MTHKMKLNKKPFEAMKNGDKKVEIRLNDEKRQKLAVGDTIEFSKMPDLKEKLIVEVKGLLPFKTFGELYDELYDGVDSDYFQQWEKDHFIIACHTVYTKEKEQEHGVLGIRIKVL